MKLLDTIKSKIDNTVKYVYLSNSNVLEFAYINKNDGKDIVCIPTQTTCNLGCKFCFLTGTKFPYRNLTSDEMFVGTSSIVVREQKNDVLLVSFMGCGEPLLNSANTIDAMVNIRHLFKNSYKIVRFAIASLVPCEDMLDSFFYRVAAYDLQMKFHYSLHTPNPELRKQLMPAACPANLVISIIDKHCNNPNHKINAEFHYSLMDGVNDSENDAELLSKLTNKYKYPVKILKLSEKSLPELVNSHNLDVFRKALGDKGIVTEYYEPPGSDVGASCGQFLLDYYEKYASK